jgi:hypothetical protein
MFERFFRVKRCRLGGLFTCNSLRFIFTSSSRPTSVETLGGPPPMLMPSMTYPRPRPNGQPPPPGDPPLETTRHETKASARAHPIPPEGRPSSGRGALVSSSGTVAFRFDSPFLPVFVHSARPRPRSRPPSSRHVGCVRSPMCVCTQDMLPGVFKDT